MSSSRGLNPLVVEKQMSFTEFQCPSCSARLRLRDRNQLLRTIPCPDCGDDLTLESDRDNNVIATAASTANAKSPQASQKRGTSDLSRIATPRNISLAVAALFLISFLVAVFWPDSSRVSGQPLVQQNVVDVVAPLNEVDVAEQNRPDENSENGNSEPQELQDPDMPGPDDSTDVTPAPDKLPGEVPQVPAAVDAPIPDPQEPAPQPPKSVAPDDGEDGGKKPSENGGEKMAPAAPAPAPEPRPDPVELEKARLAKIERQLDQKILAYEQPEPVALSRLLHEWEELSGASVSFAESVPESARQQQISVQLKNVTVREVLEALLKEAGLLSSNESGKYVIESP